MFGKFYSLDTSHYYFIFLFCDPFEDQKVGGVEQMKLLHWSRVTEKGQIKKKKTKLRHQI